MNAVASHLKRLRQRAGLTQEDLAARLHVTRQAVSSWETGKTQPDIETLTALAEALGTDVNELIYGTPAAAYSRFQRRYVVWTAVCGAIALLGIVLRFTLFPYLQWLKNVTFDMRPALAYIMAVPPLTYFAAGALLPSLASLWTDLRIASRRIRMLLLVTAALLLGVYLLWVFCSLVYRPRFLAHWVMLLTLNSNAVLRYGPLFLSGLCLFLGTNR